MNRPCTLLAALLLPLCALADGEEWRADLSVENIHNVYLRRGDTATLRNHVFVRGREYMPSSVVAKYRTNLLDRTWLTAPCRIASNVVEFVWTPLLAPGTDVVPLVFYVDGEVYRIPAMIYLRDSPDPSSGDTRPLIDFDVYDTTNAPWALASDMPVPVAPSTDPSAAGKPADAKATGDALAGKASTADATLVPIYSQTPRYGYSEWVFWNGGSHTITGPFEDAEHVWYYLLDGTTRSLNGWSVYEESLDTLGLVFFEEMYGPAPGATRTRIRTDIIGYRLGSQSDKPLAPADDYALKSDLVRAVDYSSTNAALVATIQAVSPAPGDYATVSNRAMSALQSYTETDPTVPAWAKAQSAPAESDPTVPSWAKSDTPPPAADPALASNLVAQVLAEAGQSAAATETLRIILADHQRRLDALEDADGTDALTEAQAEAIVNAMCEAWATNTIIPARIAYQSAQALAVEAAATYQLAGNPMPLSTDEIAEISYTEADAVSIDVSPRRATRYYRSADASSNLSIASFAGANNNPSWLLLGGYGSVTWPSGSAYAGSAYPGTEGGVFRIFKLNSQIYIERVY
jgi:hypothetical protein